MFRGKPFMWQKCSRGVVSCNLYMAMVYHGQICKVYHTVTTLLPQKGLPPKGLPRKMYIARKPSKKDTRANFPYRIGTPGCPIKWWFYQGPPSISAALFALFWWAPILSENNGCQFYIFWGVPKFSDHGLQFYRRLQFYRDMSVLF